MNSIQGIPFLGALFGFIDDEIEAAKRRRKEEERRLDLEMRGLDPDDPAAGEEDTHL